MIEERFARNLADVVKHIVERETAPTGATGVYETVLHAVEKPMLQTVLARFNGNQTHAARALGINRNTLRKKMRVLGISA